MTPLTPQQTAETLSVSAQTLRRWSVQFAEFLSADATPGRGRRRTYTVADLALLRRAGDLFRAGRSVEDTIALLRLGPDQADTAALEKITLPTVAGELQAARALVHQLADRVAALEQAQADQASTHQAAIDALRADLETLKARRSWWQRLRGG
jgi:DNA-binding transcriptional MerR regulator